jgi:MFS family permease
MNGIYLSRVFSSASYYSLFPFLIDLLTRKFDFGMVAAGGAIALMLLASRLFAMPAGRVIDRYGPVAFIVASNAVSMICVIALDLVDGNAALLTTLLLLVRGMAGAGQSVAYKVITHRLSDKDGLTKAFSNLANAANVGVVLGPMLSTFPRVVGMTELGVVAGFHFLSLLAVLWVGWTAAQTDRTRTEPAALIEDPHLSHSRAVFKAGAIAYIVEWMLIEQVILMLAYDCQHRLDSKELGAAFFSIQAAISIPVTYLAGRIITSKTQHHYLLSFAIGGLILALSFLSFGVLSEVNGLVGVAVFAILITLSEAIGVPASDAYISTLYPGGIGRSFSYASLLQAVGLAVGAISGAGLMAALENHGESQLFWPMFSTLGLASYSTLLWKVVRSRR